MSEQQEKFYQFIMQRIREENKEQAKRLLEESFAKQNSKTIDVAFLYEFQQIMLGFVKEESKEEVKMILNQFQKRFQ